VNGQDGSAAGTTLGTETIPVRQVQMGVRVTF
jgi:hypothetical protein